MLREGFKGIEMVVVLVESMKLSNFDHFMSDLGGRFDFLAVQQSAHIFCGEGIKEWLKFCVLKLYFDDPAAIVEPIQSLSHLHGDVCERRRAIVGAQA